MAYRIVSLLNPEDCQGGEAYRRIRERYLNLTSDDVTKLAKKYPGYGYILTEKEHTLSFDMLYTNSEYTVYEIEPLKLK
ncbi:unnamed protein product [marine sediment metagenome]|uniref:Uncharacterized protein n=1 Tax=marine sediment metagenome TaxID=412755 RepID=X1HQ92_9ZZZZ